MALELKNAECRAVIFPEFGGLINHFFINKGGIETDIIYGYTQQEDIHKRINEDFRNVKLSPFPNRIKDGKYAFNGNVYKLAVNFPKENNSIHGFLFNKAFTVKKKTAIELILSYQVDKSEFEGYPFSYVLEMRYELLERGLRCTTVIKNTDFETIPLADGFHPYFKIGKTIDTIQLKLPPVNKLLLDERMLPTLEKETVNDFISKKSIGSKVFDTCFEITTTNQGSVDTILENEGISITIQQDIGKNKYNFLQVYTPPGRKAIAIEPMTGAPNCFNNKKGLIHLNPTEEIKLGYQFTVEVDEE